MKSFLFAVAAAAVAAGASPALAQDDWDWTGLYGGLNAGGNWGDANTETVLLTGGGSVVIPPQDLVIINNELSNDSNNGGFVGGGQLGYNWQSGNLLIGAETDFGVFSLDQDNAHTFQSAVLITPPITYQVSQRVSGDWMWTLRPRIGWAGGQWLIYATGGLAVANIKLATSYSDNATPSHSAVLEDDNTRAGWVIGAGGAFKFNPRWSVGAEWLYADFGTVDADAVSNDGFVALHTETNPRANILRGRVDFHF